MFPKRGLQTDKELNRANKVDPLDEVFEGSGSTGGRRKIVEQGCSLMLYRSYVQGSSKNCGLVQAFREATDNHPWLKWNASKHLLPPYPQGQGSTWTTVGARLPAAESSVKASATACASVGVSATPDSLPHGSLTTNSRSLRKRE